MSIGCWQVGQAPDLLITQNLGSCVGIALYDKVNRIGGLAHARLYRGASSPTRNKGGRGWEGEYAHSAIEVMVGEMIRQGGELRKITAKIAGGAFMYNKEGRSKEIIQNLDIGAKIVEEARRALREKGIPLIGEEVLGTIPRTMEFDLEQGRVILKTSGLEIREI